MKTVSLTFLSLLGLISLLGRVRVARYGAILALMLVGQWGHAERCNNPTTCGNLSNGPQTLADLPLTAQYGVSASIGKDRVEYHATESGEGWASANPANQLSAHFGAADVGVFIGSDEWTMRLESVGYDSELMPVAPAHIQVQENRIEYDHGVIKAWYVNGPLGLQQGFTLLERPTTSAHHTDTLTVTLGIDGSLRPAHNATGDALTLSRLDGTAALTYRGLTAYDAMGRTLPASLEIRPDAGRQTLLIHVHDAQAQYPLTIDPLIQQAKLTASDGAANDYFGIAVAVSGNTIVIGASGATYVFTKPGSGWANMTQTAKLMASDGAANDSFGSAVAISGDTITVGAQGATISGRYRQGAAYVFVKPGSGWANTTQTAKLTASDGAAANVFGRSVGVSGDTVLIGAPEATVSGQSMRGAAYVFVKPGGGWANMTQTAKLTASDGAASALFGRFVSLDGETVAVGAPGAAISGRSSQGATYVFVKPGGGWANITQTAKLTASDGAANASLGVFVAINSDTIVAGAPGATVSGHTYQGAAYVFVKPGGGWVNMTQTAKLTASDGAASDQLSKVAISGNSVLVGASFASVSGRSNQGATYAFLKPTGGWVNMTQSEKLTASDGVAGDQFGTSVAIDNGTVVVGAYLATVGGHSSQGATYVFTTPPIATTLAATGVTPTGAVLNATVNPNNSSTTVYFQYATDPGFAGAASTGTQNIGNGGNAVSVSATLNGLLSGRIYYFRVMAANAFGSAVGTILTFVTPSPPTITTTSPLPPGTAGVAYNTYNNPLLAIGGTTPYTWSLSSGILPSGVDLDINGVISGTPDGATNTTFTVQVTGNDGYSSTKVFNLTINPAPGPADVYSWNNFVGQPGGLGNADGTGSAARFSAPEGVTVDSAGNVFVADSLNNTIRKVTPGGVVTTLAGSPAAFDAGNINGTGNIARFSNPVDVTVDSAGNVFVADRNNNAIRKITSSGVVTTFAGGAVSFGHPFGVAVDNSGNVFVADTANHTIRKVTPAGSVLTLAGLDGVSGTNNGTGSAARFNSPYGVAVDNSGNVFVADSYNYTIRKITAAGVVTTLAGSAGVSGSADGTGSAARFASPVGVTVDISGNVFVADSGNHTIRKVTPAGMVTTLAGSAGVSGSADGTGNIARFSGPHGVTVDSDGNVFVADRNNHTIRKVTSAGVVTTLTGKPPSYGSADDTGDAARFSGPEGVAVDSQGNLFVTDLINSTIRRVTSMRAVSTLAGSSGIQGSTDGTGSAARFNNPGGVAVDSAGNVYVADMNTHIIRKVTPAGVVTTLAGTAGSSGSADGTGSAARFSSPHDVAVDSAGNVFVADFFPNHTIRKITPAGVVTTLAGTAGSSGSTDGMGSEARFYGPDGVAVDDDGNIIVAEFWNSTIRKVTTQGLVTTLAGCARVNDSTDGTGSEARFFAPQGVAVDHAGNIFVADQYNHTIRRITPAGVVTTIGGTAGIASDADGIGSSARFSHPVDVAVDSEGNVFVADENNNRIVKGTPISSFRPPTATTAAATGITTSGAVLNGSVKPNNSETSAWFEYGTNATLVGSAVTGSQGIGGGSNAVAVNANLTGLLPGKTYYFRVAASNAVGTANGTILTFPTLPVETPAVTTAAATGITTSGAELNGSVNPNNSGTTVWFQYGTNATLVGSAVTGSQGIGSGGNAVAVNANLTGLLPGKTYYFRVVASNAVGVANGIILAFSTQPTMPSEQSVWLAGDFAFGSTLLSNAVYRRLTIYNGGSNDLTVSSIDYPLGFSGPFNGTISGGSREYVTVNFCPLDVADYSGRLTVVSDALCGRESAPISGRGVASGPATRYVSQSGLHRAPFLNWLDAATNIHDAVTTSTDGDTVLVADGTYVLASTIALDKGVILESVNGPSGAIISGNYPSASLLCINIGSRDAVVRGFTITGGHANGVSMTEGLLEGCILTNNWGSYGGGASIRGNAIVRNCVFSNNSSSHWGGGLTSDSTNATIENCTIVFNSGAYYGGGIQGNGIFINNIVYWNTAQYGPNIWGDNPHYTFTHPMPAGGIGNSITDPLLVDRINGDYRLSFESPCINAGTYRDWMATSTAIDGAARIINGRVDVGAYEWKGNRYRIVSLSPTGRMTWLDPGLYPETQVEWRESLLIGSWLPLASIGTRTSTADLYVPMDHDCAFFRIVTPKDPFAPPSDVTSFAAVPGNGEVLLAWLTPVDIDFEGVKIQRKTGSYPLSPSDGMTVYNGTGTSTTDTGLSNGTQYYYKAFSYDEVPNYSSGSTATATPQAPADITPPGNVSSFMASAGNGAIALSWTNPGDADYQGVKILRKTGSYPTSTSDGTVVHNGTGTSKTDTGLSNGTQYYYKAFSYDAVPNYSSGVTSTATPQAPVDTTPPGNVSSFTATAGDRQVFLSWSNPSDVDFQGVTICRKTGGYPTGPSDGGIYVGHATTSYTDTGLVNGTRYYYKAFSYDEVPNYSSGSTATAMPAGSGDTTPPGNVTLIRWWRGNSEVRLAWKLPTDTDFSGVKVLRKTTGYPSTPTDGTTVFQGSAVGYLDTGLGNGTLYYYKVFSFDSVPNYSSGSTISATPSSVPDITPPSNVTGFTATAGSGRVTLSWQWPSDPDILGVYIYRKTGSYPAFVGDGTFVVDAYFVGTPSWSDVGLVSGTKYYYTAFTFDGVPVTNFSTGSTAAATPTL